MKVSKDYHEDALIQELESGDAPMIIFAKFGSGSRMFEREQLHRWKVSRKVWVLLDYGCEERRKKLIFANWFEQKYMRKHVSLRIGADWWVEFRVKQRSTWKRTE